MRLHGIEMAKPEEWWMAMSGSDGRFQGHTQVFARQVALPDYPQIDCGYIVDKCGYVYIMVERRETVAPVHRIVFGPTGTIIGTGSSLAEAMENSQAKLLSQFDQWERQIIGWLETHPLSPRYRYTGGG